jgi:hypothetical protein
MSAATMLRATPSVACSPIRRAAPRISCAMRATPVRVVALSVRAPSRANAVSGPAQKSSGFSGKPLAIRPVSARRATAVRTRAQLVVQANLFSRFYRVIKVGPCKMGRQGGAVPQGTNSMHELLQQHTTVCTSVCTCTPLPVPHIRFSASARIAPAAHPVIPCSDS